MHVGGHCRPCSAAPARGPRPPVHPCAVGRAPWQVTCPAAGQPHGASIGGSVTYCGDSLPPCMSRPKWGSNLCLPFGLSGPGPGKMGAMISSAAGSSLLNYLTAQTSQNAGSPATGGAFGTTTSNANVPARVAATSQAALATAASRHSASTAGQALDKQQSALSKDLLAAMSRSGVKLSGAVEFSVSSDGSVGIKGNASDKAATTAFLKADNSRPSFAMRVATQARDALKLSSTIQQSAAISQAARYAGKSGDVMSLYNSLMAQSNTTAAVFSVSASSSSLTYPGALATKA